MAVVDPMKHQGVYKLNTGKEEARRQFQAFHENYDPEKIKLEQISFSGDSWSRSASDVEYRAYVDPETGTMFFEEITEENREAYQREKREKEWEEFQEYFQKMAIHPSFFYR